MPYLHQKSNSHAPIIDYLNINIDTSEPLNTISKRALLFFNKRYGIGYIGSLRTNKDFIARITVNYLRHEYTPYDTAIANLIGQTGSLHAKEQLRERVYWAIADKYAPLRKECLRQLNIKH